MNKNKNKLVVMMGLLLCMSSLFAQDTTVSIATEYRNIPGAKYTTTASRPDTVERIIRQTIVVTRREIVYVDSSKPVVADPGTATEAYLSKQVSKDFLLFANYCSRNKKKCVVDMPITFRNTIVLPPGYYKFTDSAFNYAYPAFNFTNGNYTFDGLRLRQYGHSQLVYNYGVTDTTLFVNCRVDSGENVYYSQNGGGKWDEATDSVLVWSGATLKDCRFATYMTAVISYAQPGPSKYLHFENTSLYCDRSHPVYSHSNVSIKIHGLHIENFGLNLVSKNPGLAWRSSTGGKGVARYVDIEGVSGVGEWQLFKPRGVGYIRNCQSFKGYANPIQSFVYENDSLSGYVKGTVTNCRGGQVFATDNTTIVGGNFNEINVSQGGTVAIKKANIKAMFGSSDATGKALYLTLSNTVVKSFRVYNGGSQVTLYDDARIESYAFGWKPPVGMITIR